jgi:prepilin-type processing-associated H-X9-DG protein/prepilin-type N-terminal cleavage/methylation domain-containing protein
MHRISTKHHRAGFSLLELLIVTGIIVILLGFIIIAVGGGVRFADSAVCAKKISSLSSGLVLFAEDYNGELPWAGGADRNMHKDWVWGGQGKSQTRRTSEWNNPSPSFGHHAEAGGAFPYITGIKLHRKKGVKYGGDSSGETEFDPIDFDYDNDGIKAFGLVDQSHLTIYEEYRCPNSGEYDILAKALRVNYSMSAWIDNERKNSWLINDIHENWNVDFGTFLSHIRKPALKILMADEDSRTMHNASIWPAGSADGDGHTGIDFDGGSPMVMHNKKTNISFVDGHVERMPTARIWMIQQSIGSIKSNGPGMGLTGEEIRLATTNSKGADLPGNYYKDLYWQPLD